MPFQTKNKIRKGHLLGFVFVLFVFLLPISFSLTYKNDDAPLTSIVINTSYAADSSFISKLGNDVFQGVASWLGNIILSIASAFTWFGGLLFEKSLALSVFGMGSEVNNTSGLGGAINTTWKIIRDIANLAFIFGFVYVGIRTIIDPDSSSPKRFLSKIIIGALLINFSLFFVKIIVDFANFTSYQIYTSMMSGGGTLSATIADMLGIVTIFKAPNPETFANMTGGGMLWFYILSAVLLLVVAFVFIAAGLLLISRYVGLILIMIASPVLFAAPVFPQTEGMASDLWKKLIHYAFFPPLFLLLLFISLTLIKGLGTGINGAGFVEALTQNNASTLKNSTDAFGIILKFTVIIFFFVQSLLIAQKLGIAGGNTAVSLGNKLRGKAQNLLGTSLGASTFGIAGALGRGTVGRWSHNYSESDTLKDAASRGGIGGWTARRKLQVARAVGDASFDARNVSGLGKGIGAGEGRKGGYKTILGEIEKKESEFAQSLGEVGDDDIFVETRKKEMQNTEKKQREEEEELNRLRQSGADKGALAKQRENVEAAKRDVEKAKLQYESEKQRRIIGSTFANEHRSETVSTEVQKQQKEIADREKDIKNMWEGTSGPNGLPAYTDLPKDGPARALRRKQIDELKKGLVELKKSHRTYVNKQKDQGYAGVLENSSGLTAWPIGRLATQEIEAGKAIRKTAEKGLPKKKDS